METSYKHDDHKVQREFERIRRWDASSKKAADSGASGGQPPAGPSQPPSTGILGISGAINNETASPPIYVGFRLKSDTTIDVTKNINAADKLFQFIVSRPLTIEHNEVAVEDEASVHRSDTVRFLDFKDNSAVGGISFTVTSHENLGIQVSASSWIFDVQQWGNCTSVDTPYNFYAGYTDSGTTRTFNMRNFNVTNDIKMLVCTNGGYVMDVNITGVNLGTGIGVYDSKDPDTSTLKFRSIKDGTGISIALVDGDIVISSTVADTNTTYALSAVSASGSKLRLTGSDSSTTDVQLTSSDGSVTITIVSATQIDFTATGGGGGSGNTYGVANVGTGTGNVWRDTTVVGSAYTFNLRTIKSGSNVTITNNADDITISATDTNTTYTYTVTDGTTGHYNLNLIGSDSSVNTVVLAQGSNVTITRSGSTLTIASADTNTTYTYYAVTTTGGAIARLHGSDSSDNDISFLGSGATTVSYINSTTIQISSTDTNNTYAVDNCASGTGTGYIYHDNTVSGSLTTFHLRTIKAGTGTNVTTSGHDVIISCTLTDTNTTYSTDVINTGGVYLRLNGSDATHSNTLFTGTGGITVTMVDAHTINIDNSVVDTNNTYAIDNCASGTGTGFVYHDSTVVGSFTTFHLRTLKAGTGTSITTSGHDITISCTVTDTNDTYSMTNVGTGTGLIWRDTTDAGSAHTFNIKSLKSGTGISITNNANDITIACTVSVITYSHRIVNITGSVYLRLDGSDSSVDDILFSSTDGSITITRVSDDQINFKANFPTQQVYTIDNCASGTGLGFVYHDSTTAGATTTYHLRTIKAGTGMTVSTSGHDIIIDCNVTDTNTTYSTDVTNTSGVQLRLNGSDSTHSNTLFTGSGGIVVTMVDAHTINIANTVVDTNDTYFMTNIGTGVGQLWRDTTNVGSIHTFNIKNIIQGNYIVITNGTDDITIDAWTIDAQPFGSCTTGATPYNWLYTISDDTPSKTRTLYFRNYNVANDLKQTVCGLGGVILDVNIQGANLGSGYGTFFNKDGATSTLQFVSLVPGAGIDISTTATDGELVLSCTVTDTNTTYSLSSTFDSGTGGSLLHLNGSDSSDSTILFTGSGIAVVNTAFHHIDVYVPAPDPIVTYEIHATDGDHCAYLTLGGSDSTTDDVKFVGSGATNVWYIDDDTIQISSTDTNSTYSTANVGAGTGNIWRDTTAGSPSVFNLRTIKGQGEVIVATSGDMVTVSYAVFLDSPSTGQSLVLTKTISGYNSTLNIKGIRCDDGSMLVTSDSTDVVVSAYILHYVAASLGSGTYSVYASTTGAGTSGSPYSFNFKTIDSGAGIAITDASNVLTIKTAFQVTAASLIQSNVASLVITSDSNGIIFTHSTGVANQSTVEAIIVSYGSSYDLPKFVDSGSLVSGKTIANHSWEIVYFENCTITDDPSWVVQDSAVSPYFHFDPDDLGDELWQISAFLHVNGRDVTNNALPASLNLPMIALFIGDTFYRMLDVDQMVGAYAQMRAAYLVHYPGESAVIPQSGSAAVLHGTTIVKLVDATDKLNLRFKHYSGADRYVEIVDGYFDITKVGYKPNTGTTVQSEADYSTL